MFTPSWKECLWISTSDPIPVLASSTLRLGQLSYKSSSGVHRYFERMSVYQFKCITLTAVTMGHPTPFPDSRSAGLFLRWPLFNSSCSRNLILLPRYIRDHAPEEQWGKIELCEEFRTKSATYELLKTTGRNRMDKLQYTNLSREPQHNWFSECPFSKHAGEWINKLACSYSDRGAAPWTFYLYKPHTPRLPAAPVLFPRAQRTGWRIVPIGCPEKQTTSMVGIT